MESLQVCLFVLTLGNLLLSYRGGIFVNGELTLAEFKEKIATGDEWIGLYRIEIGQPTERIRMKIKARWTMIGEDKSQVLRNTVTWRPDLERCALVDVYTDPDEAEDWGKGGMVLKQFNSTFKRQVRFRSENASVYFWWIVCFNRENMVGHHCPDMIVMLMVPISILTERREADISNLPWEDIIDDFHSVNETLRFEMPRLRYTWLGNECDLNNNEIELCPGATSGATPTADYKWFPILAALSLSRVYLQIRKI